VSDTNRHQHEKLYLGTNAGEQPRILAPEEIPAGYRQTESGLLIKISVAGNVAMRTAETGKPYTIEDFEREIGYFDPDEDYSEYISSDEDDFLELIRLGLV